MPRNIPNSARDVDLEPILDIWAEVKQIIRTDFMVSLRGERTRISECENQIIVYLPSIIANGFSYPRDLMVSAEGYHTDDILQPDDTLRRVERLPRIVIRYGQVVGGFPDEPVFDVSVEEGIGNRLLFDFDLFRTHLANAREALLAFPEALAAAHR